MVLAVLAKAADISASTRNKMGGKLKAKDGTVVYWPARRKFRKLLLGVGLSPFGYDRLWSEIAFPEALGLAEEALSNNPNDPVDYICEVFKLKRRSPKTLNIFKSWVDSVKILKLPHQAPNVLMRKLFFAGFINSDSKQIKSMFIL